MAWGDAPRFPWMLLCYNDSHLVHIQSQLPRPSELDWMEHSSPISKKPDSECNSISYLDFCWPIAVPTPKCFSIGWPVEFHLSRTWPLLTTLKYRRTMLTTLKYRRTRTNLVRGPPASLHGIGEYVFACHVARIIARSWTKLTNTFWS